MEKKPAEMAARRADSSARNEQLPMTWPPRCRVESAGAPARRTFFSATSRRRACSPVPTKDKRLTFLAGLSA
eukprot:9468626-Pyramimonas_sp.AAC.1